MSDRASDDESDDDSLPPGVVLVTELSDRRNEVHDEEKKVKGATLIFSLYPHEFYLNFLKAMCLRINHRKPAFFE